jgi:hypothetical protein
VTARVVHSNPGWLAKLLRSYENKEVLAVGYPASETGGIRYPDGTPVILVAAVNNYGSQSMGIPARPFMQEGAVAALSGDAGKVAAELVPLLNQGKITAKEILRQMGPFAEASFKGVFTGVAWVANADYTVLMKGSAQPLIDTGLLRASLTHVVRSR